MRHKSSRLLIMTMLQVQLLISTFEDEQYICFANRGKKAPQQYSIVSTPSTHTFCSCVRFTHRGSNGVSDVSSERLAIYRVMKG